MWIFLTAVFLVLFFLFYRHPKPMLKIMAALVGFLGLAAYGFIITSNDRLNVSSLL